MTAATTPKVSVNSVTHSFGEVTALENVSLTLADNEFVSVVGTSGCGKSTLLSLIAGLDSPTSGTIDCDGQPVVAPGRDRGVIFQSATLLPWLTTQRNVEFALEGEAELSRQQRRDVARENLNLVGLSGFENHYPAQLSGGMQQRVALARSLSYAPQALLMDEPFGALDALTRRDMQQLLTKVWEQRRMTVMLITHDIEEAVLCSDRVVVMSARPGRVKREFTIELPRPREQSLIATPQFREYYTAILDLIHDQ